MRMVFVISKYLVHAMFFEGGMLFRTQKASHAVVWVNIKYEIYAFFGSEIYAYVFNKHASELIPFPKERR